MRFKEAMKTLKDKVGQNKCYFFGNVEEGSAHNLSQSNSLREVKYLIKHKKCFDDMLG